MIQISYYFVVAGIEPAYLQPWSSCTVCFYRRSYRANILPKALPDLIHYCIIILVIIKDEFSKYYLDKRKRYNSN